MCNIDYDYPEVYSTTYRKAKKSHQCTECYRDILVGEKYQYVFGKWDGKISTFKTCAHCVVAQKWLHKECNGWLFGNVYADILEHAQEYQNMNLFRLAIGIARKWKNFKNGELMKVPT